MSSKTSTWTFAAVLFAVSFGLNWVWEVAQMFAYSVKSEEIWTHVLLYCSSATVVDALVTVGSYSLGTMISRNRDWEINNGWKIYALLALLGAIWALIFELAAKGLGLWSYNKLMPSVPIIEIGLLPLLQLTLLMPAALLLTVWWHKQEEKEK